MCDPKGWIMTSFAPHIMNKSSRNPEKQRPIKLNPFVTMMASTSKICKGEWAQISSWLWNTRFQFGAFQLIPEEKILPDIITAFTGTSHHLHVVMTVCRVITAVWCYDINRESTVAFRGQTFQGQSNHDIPSYFKEVNNEFQCNVMLDSHVCICVFIPETQFCLLMHVENVLQSQFHLHLSLRCHWEVYRFILFYLVCLSV